MLPVEEDEAVQLAALQIQIELRTPSVDISEEYGSRTRIQRMNTI